MGSRCGLEDARRPFILERNGMRIGFSGQAPFVNAATSAFAPGDRSGLAPLDPFVIEEDIRRLRDQVDRVVVSFRWA